VTVWFEAGTDAVARERVVRQDQISFVGASELIDLARIAGLVPVTIAGDYDMTPLSAESERIVLVARAAPA